MCLVVIILVVVMVLVVGGCNCIGGGVDVGKVVLFDFDKLVFGEIILCSGINYNDGSYYQFYQIKLEDK